MVLNRHQQSSVGIFFMDNVVCFKCGGSDLWRNGYRNGIRYYFCKKCKWAFPENGLIYKKPIKCPHCGGYKTKKLYYKNKELVTNYFCYTCSETFLDLEILELFNNGKIKCKKCGEIKPLEEFYKRNEVKNGYVRTCKSCRPKKNFIKYGLTEKEFDEILISQNSICTICGIKLNTNNKTMAHIDHCHKTGIVRGMLCHACNKILGFARDDIQILKNAIKYLKEHT